MIITLKAAVPGLLIAENYSYSMAATFPAYLQTCHLPSVGVLVYSNPVHGVINSDSCVNELNLLGDDRNHLAQTHTKMPDIIAYL